MAMIEFKCRVNVGQIGNIKHKFWLDLSIIKERDTTVKHGSHPVTSNKNQGVSSRLTLINLRQKHAII